MKNISLLFILLPFLSHAQSTDKNYIKTKIYKDSITTPITNPTALQATVSLTYYDGLGRPMQQIASKYSATGKDIVTPIAYDALGRQAKEYLPFPSSASTMLYDASAIANAASFYSTQYGSEGVNPYSEKVFEASPLNRVLEQAAPGSAWANNYPTASTDHTIKFAYLPNTATATADKVKLFKANAVWDSDLGYYNVTLTNSAGTTYFPVDRLFMNVVKDENWTSGNNNTTQEFKNQQGQLILQRKFSGTSATPHDTYYVYDQFGNLSYVIPPLAPTNINSDVLTGLCYQYRYDAQNRLVEKKLPGKQWEFIVYDYLDRIVATGPANFPFTDLTANKGWLVTKYDAFNRPILTAWISSGTSLTSADRKSLQSTRDAQVTNLNEAKSTTDTTINGIGFRYTTVAYPTSGYHVLTVNYYDDYAFTGAPTTFTTVEGQIVHFNNTTRKPTGLLTGFWVRALLSSTSNNSRELTYNLYDYMGRVIRTRKTPYSRGFTQVDTKYDFSGKVLYTIKTHKRTDTGIERYEKNTFTYSDQGRMLTHTHKMSATGSSQLLTKNEYDELGQLKFKRVGGSDTTGATGLQKVDYSYNIRGWLTAINDVNGTETEPANISQGADPYDLFRFKIAYQTVENTVSGNVKGLFNGNISETSWRTKSDNTKRRYGYKYDALNRLEQAYYQKPSDATPISGSYNEGVTYDKNGNIATMYRMGDYDDPVYTLPIDNLVYKYALNTNQLIKVTDIDGNTSGFKDGVDATTEYYYDSNGNLGRDDNKGITGTIYNHLDLPMKISFGTNTIEYVYNALGEKLKKTVVDNGVTTTTDYLDGYQYLNAELKQFATTEGYVSVSSYVFGGVTTISNSYIFNYTDHLGNIRLSYAPYDDTLAIFEENNYYPFGMKHKNYNVSKLQYDNSGGMINVVTCLVCDYNYKYNGQEWQDELGLNMYDMEYRDYDPAIARWVVMDPVIHHNVSPYNAFDNNPVFWSDPNGADVIVTPNRIGADGADAASLYNALLEYMDDGESQFSATGQVYSSANRTLGEAGAAGGMTNPKLPDGKFPRFSKLLSQTYDYVKNNPEVMRLLKWYSGLSAVEILNNLSENQGVTLAAVYLEGKYGRTPPDKSGIQISLSYINGLEMAKLNETIQGTSFLLMGTILHELVHYGRMMKGLSEGTSEYGDAFEYYTFGASLQYYNANQIYKANGWDFKY